ncbi:MAG: ABC transporter permease [Microthrixaceae bacterium]
MSRNVLTVVMLDLRRLARDRLALFFVFVLPFVLITAIGTMNAGGEIDATVVVIDRDGSPLAAELTESIEGDDRIEVVGDRTLREAERDLRIGRLGGIVVIPEGFTRSVSEGDAVVTVTTDPTGSDAALVDAVLSGAIDSVGRELTVAAALEEAGVPDAPRRAAATVEQLTASPVETTVVGSGSELSIFAFAAGGQMILFMFINSLTAGSMLIEMRRLGILDRIRAGPVAPSDVVFGLGLARFCVACTLAVLILVFSSAVYGVSWGSPFVVAAVVVLFGLVSAGASVLFGTLLDQPDSAVSVGVPVGLGMAALGGCMFPLVLAPDAMQVAAKVLTPMRGP